MNGAHFVKHAVTFELHVFRRNFSHTYLFPIRPDFGSLLAWWCAAASSPPGLPLLPRAAAAAPRRAPPRVSTGSGGARGQEARDGTGGAPTRPSSFWFFFVTKFLVFLSPKGPTICVMFSEIIKCIFDGRREKITRRGSIAQSIFFIEFP